ncbi:MAG: YabP/YqfC family sporulation protein [Clostridia bacterium]|nr:YabP/YqfC family sporulation protein [Clostridia bacterium]MBR7159679.1 YabP/YqfC family sporulation protein [Clostridia bacterium]
MHKLCLVDHSSLHVEGVKSVIRYNDKEILLALEDKKLSIGGDHLSLTRIDTVGKIADIEGDISSMRYSSGQGQGLLKKILK